MPLDEKTLDEIQREVKGFGDDFKKLSDSMQRDLKAARDIAEEAKKMAEGGAPETKQQIEALTTSVNEKNEALGELLKKQADRTDELEAAFKRMPTGGVHGGDPEAQVKAAVAFFEAKEAMKGNHQYTNRPTAETIDREGYDLWAKEFDTYLRSPDERRIQEKALSIGTNPDGGYLVPTQISNRIVTKIWETSPLRQLATVETIGTSELLLPIDVDEAAAGWVGETESRPDTGTPQVGVQKIPVFELYAKPKATQAMLEDGSINIEMWLANKIANKLSRVEATAFVTGNGVNKPRGILTYTAGTGRDKLPQQVSGAATSITADAIVKMPFNVKASYMAAGTWLMNRSTVPTIMTLKDGDGQYLWRPSVQMGNPTRGGAGDAASGVVYTATLGGYPVALADDMPAVASSALSVAFGDFRRGYTVVDRLGITTLRDPYSAKPFVEFYSRKRVGGAVVDFDAITLMKISA